MKLSMQDGAVLFVGTMMIFGLLTLLDALDFYPHAPLQSGGIALVSFTTARASIRQLAQRNSHRPR